MIRRFVMPSLVNLHEAQVHDVLLHNSLVHWASSSFEFVKNLAIDKNKQHCVIWQSSTYQ
jgi:hypothetical protein